MADWSKAFDSSYRLVRVDRSTLHEKGVLPNAVADGSTIQRNASTATYESGSLNVVGSLGIGNDLLRIYLDAAFPDGTSESVALGTFLAAAPKRSISGPASTLSVGLVGRLSEAAEDEFDGPVAFAVGTNAVEAAAGILEGCGIEVVADESDWTLSSPWVAGLGGSGDEPTDKLGIANKLLALAGFASATTDGLGRALLRRYVEPCGRSPSWTFEEGPAARFLSTAEEERDGSGVANVVKAVYSTQGATVVGIAVDDDPRSPWSTATLGRRRVKRYEYNDEATQEEADARAAELLRTQQSIVHRVNLSHVYAPVAPNDLVGVAWPTAGIAAQFAIRTQALSLGAGCLTRSELRRFVRNG